MQKKTERPLQFEITEQTTEAVTAWIAAAHLKSAQFLFPSRVSESPHLSTRQYFRIVGYWVWSIGLNPAAYGTHSLRCTKPTLIYRRTKNLRAVQLLLGHSKLESTVWYLGIEVNDALEIAEQTEVSLVVPVATAGFYGRLPARSGRSASRPKLLGSGHSPWSCFVGK